ncbi:hypothetical protein [Nocardioides marmoribigeumensis]|jgi:NADPH:quinone reductase-like Zn-dependent oxidoreductase|nr:hypothetical protein [Nocardioides marmoribigeumensis]
MTYAEYGDTSVLSLTDRPDPKVGPGEVLVRVRAASAAFAASQEGHTPGKIVVTV